MTYSYSDPRLLGEMLALWAISSFSRGARQAIYELNDHRYRFVAEGTPFRVEVHAMKEEPVSLFSVMNTGDGLTFEFQGRTKNFSNLDLTVLSAVRDQAARMQLTI